MTRQNLSGLRLAMRRDVLGMTRKELAEAIGKREEDIEAYETGKLRMPRAVDIAIQSVPAKPN